MTAFRYSIERIKESKDTGQRPVVVSCDDFEDYLCKYVRGLPANGLMTEWIAAKAAKAAGLFIPQMALVEIAVDHRPGADVLVWKDGRFQLPFFGLKYVKAKEVDNSVVALFKKQQERNKIEHKPDLLRIALFDIWISNEDRHDGNYNLLMRSRGNKYQWQVMDHGAAFNTQNALNYGLAELTYQDSLLGSRLLNAIFKKPYKFAALIKKLQDELDGWVKLAQDEAIDWIDEAPDAWSVDKDSWKKFCQDEWLSQAWTTRVKQCFVQHGHSMINSL